MRILLIEDDESIAETLSIALTAENMTVDHAVSGEEGLEMINLYKYQLVALDLGLPDMEGFSLLENLRAAKKNVSVLVISARADIEIRLACLDAGADDYLVKPFEMNEVIARARALVRRANGHSSSLLEFGGLTLDMSTYEVRVADRLVDLTNKEYKILEILCLRGGGIVTKGHFLDHLYNGMDEPEIKIIDVFVCNLRKKIKGSGINDPIIETLWGRGYRIHPAVAASLLSVEPQEPLDPLPEMKVKTA
ncbi:MAG: response regulator transcription factor [Alphaproteobacteria bacterium]|nr:response regulator transcription factor [Alphaproteobacteria bacterium]